MIVILSSRFFSAYDFLQKWCKIIIIYFFVLLLNRTKRWCKVNSKVFSLGLSTYVYVPWFVTVIIPWYLVILLWSYCFYIIFSGNNVAIVISHNIFLFALKIQKVDTVNKVLIKWHFALFCVSECFSSAELQFNINVHYKNYCRGVPYCSVATHFLAKLSFQHVKLFAIARLGWLNKILISRSQNSNGIMKPGIFEKRFQDFTVILLSIQKYFFDVYYKNNQTYLVYLITYMFICALRSRRAFIPRIHQTLKSFKIMGNPTSTQPYLTWFYILW